jgi:hypothetical protein
MRRRHHSAPRTDQTVMILKFVPSRPAFRTAPRGQKREWPGYISRWRCSADDDGARLDGIGGPSLKHARVSFNRPIARFFYEAWHLQCLALDPRASRNLWRAPPPWDDSLIAILPRPSRSRL